MSEENQQQPVTALQDLIAGGIAGSASVCVGHPFDTYKVMLQTSSGKINSGQAIQSPLSFMKLYRGMGAPLSTAAVVNALIFSSFGESSRLWDDYFFPQEGLHHPTRDVPLHEHPHEPRTKHESPDHTTWQKSFVCGSFAGAVQALVVCPTEHVKCRIQIQNNIGYAENKLFRGPFDALYQIVHGYGVRGLYRGFVCTTWREVPAFGLYFSAYDYIKDTVSNELASSSIIGASTAGARGLSNDDGAKDIDMSSMKKNMLHTWAASSLAGGLSGALTWAIIYPFDVIKTRIQTSSLDTPIEKRRIMYIYRQIMQEHGWRFFFRGLGVTLLRAFPVNAIIFPVYEFTLEHLTESGIGGPSTLASSM